MASPQDMKRVTVRPTESTRFQASAAKISTDFIDTTSKALSQQEDARKALETKRQKYFTTEYENKADLIRGKAEAKLSMSQGMNTVEELRISQQELRKQLDDELEAVPEAYRPYAAQKRDGQFVKFEKFGLPYAVGQIKKAEKSAFDTRVKNDIDYAVMESADVDTFVNSGLSKVTDSIIEKAKNEGLTDDDAAYHVYTGRSQAILKSIEQHAKLKRPESAVNLFTKLTGEMTPKDRAIAAGLMKEMENDQEADLAMGLVAMAEDAYPDNLVKQGEFITANAKKDTIQRRASAMLSSKASLARQQKTIDTENTLESLNADIQARKPLDMAKLKSLPDDEEKKFTKYYNETRGQGNVVTNFEVRDVVEERIRRANHPSQLPNLNAYSHLISKEDMDPLRARAERIHKAQKDDVAKAQLANDPEVDQVVQEFLRAKGIHPRSKKAGEVQSQARRRYEQLLIQNPRANTLEVRKILNADMTERMIVEKKESILFGMGTSTSRDINKDFADNTPYVSPKVRETIKARKPDWDEAKINAYILFIQKTNPELLK